MASTRIATCKHPLNSKLYRPTRLTRIIARDRFEPCAVEGNALDPEDFAKQYGAGVSRETVCLVPITPMFSEKGAKFLADTQLSSLGNDTLDAWENCFHDVDQAFSISWLVSLLWSSSCVKLSFSVC